ncbi:AP2 domain protein [Bacillus phage vB_BboS-125]|uniref:AP2 domain protein n=1 Tax=Bacillus phage vB_BboS-125 TaxID=2419618 RepID=A0A3G3BVW9_9CAUD|nr:AP2 domain protein [Bacillus phage vB_BboS-125]AYP68403.1 AP2 domain protein [Bacillus phage vB_BboS-125]
MINSVDKIYEGAVYVDIPTRAANETFIIDRQDLDKVREADRWGLYKDAKGRKFARSGRDSGQKLLHKLLFEIPKGSRLVWKNEDTLDCRRSNLQLVDKDGNVTELEKQGDNQVDTIGVDVLLALLEPEKPTSKVKGVYFHKAANKWTASAYWEGKRHSLGYYDDQVEAEKIVTAFREAGPEGVKKLRGIN